MAGHTESLSISLGGFRPCQSGAFFMLLSIIMAIINFTSSKTAAFKKGFLKGLAAPYMLYGSFRMPKTLEIKSVKATSLKTDLKNISKDFHIAIIKYDQK